MTEIPGGPGFTDSPGESNFVLAAAVEVNKLIQANRVNRRVIIGLVAMMVLVAVIVGGLVVGAIELHKEDVSSCQSGNTFRSEQNQIWDHFIGILVTKNTPKATLAIADDYLAYVAKVDTLRDCDQYWP